MTFLVSPTLVQLTAWSIGLLQLILSLYVIIINSRHVVNRYTSALFLLMAVNNFAVGSLIEATSASEALWATAYLAATTGSMGFILAFIAIILVKPSWIFGKVRWPLWVVYSLWTLPIALTAIDLIFGTQVWYLGVPPDYAGGYISFSEYTGLPVFRMFYLAVIPLIGLAPLGYLAFFDKQIERRYRNLARLFFLGELGAVVLQMALRPIFPQPLPTIVVSLTFIFIYAYASFAEMAFERRLQRGRLQIRLTLLTLAVSIPFLIFVSFYGSRQTGAHIRQDALSHLQQNTHSVATTVETWLSLNIQSLKQMVLQPEMASMDPAQQKPIVEAVDIAHPHMYLVSTTDQAGINLARSDENAPKDYSDRQWYQKAIQGEEVVFQTLIGRTSGEPALVVSMPIYGESGEIVGVGMFASDLNDISAEVVAGALGETGQVFVVDAENRVVAHTNPDYANQLLDFSTHPAVAAMRSRDTENGYVHYTAPDGSNQIAYFQETLYGWGVISEQDESNVLATLRAIRLSRWLLVLAGTVLLGTLTALTIRQAVRPINSLTETARAIVGGDLNRMAPVESEDEIGLLATTFNQMTEQLLELIGNLERRVAERTQALEKRSDQLAAAAEVGRAAATILDVNELMREAVALIRERFEFYYVGLFLLDETQKYAILSAGTGEPGQRMVAREHKIRVGEGMIGWAIANNRPRVAMDVGEDAIHKPTAELRDTRSEAALPLRSRGAVIGALTVQSTQPGAFDEATVAVLQTLADLVSAAIDNARLYTQTETALQSARRAYRERSREDWLALLRSRPDLSFHSDYRGTNPATGEWSPEMKRAWLDGEPVLTPAEKTEDGVPKLAIPIKVRGNVIGVVQLSKPEDLPIWTDEEQAMLVTIIEQIGMSLDSARLYEQTQLRAETERVIGEASARMRETLDIETVLQTAARELRAVLDLAEVEIRMGLQPAGDDEE